MSVVLYTKGDSCEIDGVKCNKEIVAPESVATYLARGYVTNPKELKKKESKSAAAKDDTKEANPAVAKDNTKASTKF